MNKFEPTGFLLAVFARRRPELFLEAGREMGQCTESRQDCIGKIAVTNNFRADTN